MYRYRYLPLYFLVVLIVIRDEPPGKLDPNIFVLSLLSLYEAPDISDWSPGQLSICLMEISYN